MTGARDGGRPVDRDSLDDRTFLHDILNQLFIIQGRTEAALLALDAAHPLRGDIIEAHRACQRAVEITDAWRRKFAS